jgi:hypothetical protein
MRIKVKKSSVIAVLLLMLLLIGSIRLSYYQYDHTEEFVFSEHLDETAVEIDGEEIPLQELSYYIMVLEEKIEEMAVVYDEEDPDAFWRIYTNGDFLVNTAEELAMETCIKDNLYTMEAEKIRLTLDEDDETQIEEEVDTLCEEMTDKQKQVTGLDKELLTQIKKKQYLSAKYELLAGEDAYDSVYAAHTVKINTKLWDKVKLGTITI